MKISGDHSVAFPREQAYAILQDPVVLARCMPGCESLDRIGDAEYRMKMKMKLASIAGLFDGKVKIAEPNPPESFRLIVDGSGKIGFMKGDGLLTLTESPQGTEVHFEGDVQVGGTLAAVGQRLVDTTARMLIRKFFENIGGLSLSLPGHAS